VWAILFDSSIADANGPLVWPWDSVPTPICVSAARVRDYLRELTGERILRQHRTNSELIHTDRRNDTHSEYPDWPKAARETIAAQKPKFELMMIGLNDRKQVREAAQVAPAPRVGSAA
jgi:hypothetical protein